MGSSERKRGCGRALIWLSAVLAFLLPATLQAEERRVALGFSNLVARVQDGDGIGFARPEFRVYILEALRGAGFNAVGAESLVFSKDNAERAELVLGGTVKEFACQRLGRARNCRIGIAWEVLDRAADRVVYRTFTRHMEAGINSTNAALVGERLVLGALRSLMARPHFVELTQQQRVLPVSDDNYSVATLGRCQAPERQLPASFGEVADATVLLKVGDGHGSGFFLAAEGLILTAAHVVEQGNVLVITRQGESLPGRVVRVSARNDVALVAVTSPAGKTFPCLSLELSAQSPGNEVYAVGAPADLQLAASLTRGIVSGLRSIEGVSLLQTDASISPGNSGGPLIDPQARVVGVVSRKLAGRAVEGVGFAVPIQDALSALKLEPSFETASSLLRGPAASRTAQPHALVVDMEDRVPSLDPVGDARRRRMWEWQQSRPAYITPMRYAGVVAIVAGSIGATYSWTAYKLEGEETREAYERSRLANDVSWGIGLLGTAAVVASYWLEPDEPDEPDESQDAVATGSRRPKVSLRLSRDGVGVRF